MKRLLTLMICLLVLSMALPVALAQDELPEGWVEFTSEDEVFYIAHPEEYFAGMDAESPVNLAVANSEELLERLTNEDDEDDAAVSGDQAIEITVIPAELMGMMGVEVTEETTVEVLLETFQMLQNANLEEGDTPWEFGEINVGEGEGNTFGFQEVVIPDDEVEGYLITTQAEGVVVYMVIAAYTGEFTDEWFTTGLGIVETVNVNATAEELLEMFMASLEADAEATEEASE